MIATWMLYAALIGILVGVAALSLERAASALRLPSRFIWVAALLGITDVEKNGLMRLAPFS